MVRYFILLLSVICIVCSATAASAGTQFQVQADMIWVEKGARKMYLMRGHSVLRTYSISLGSVPYGDKQQEGDSRTPEGLYFISGRNPNSRFYLSLHVSYPSYNDWKQARVAGHLPGGSIMIHGEPNDAQERAKLRRSSNRDWTNGCIAVNNRAMEEIWEMVPDGVPILIDP